MATEAQGRHLGARSHSSTYARARARLARRRTALLGLCSRSVDGRTIEAAAGMVVEADMLCRRVADRLYGNLDAGDQGDWIKGRSAAK